MAVNANTLNKFAMVNIIVKRTTALVAGAQPRIEKPDQKPVQTALRELQEGKLQLEPRV